LNIYEDKDQIKGVYVKLVYHSSNLYKQSIND